MPIVRWGGEEFIFFFPDMNGDEVCLMLNTFRMKLGNDLFDWRRMDSGYYDVWRGGE